MRSEERRADKRRAVRYLVARRGHVDPKHCVSLVGLHIPSLEHRGRERGLWAESAREAQSVASLRTSNVPEGAHSPMCVQNSDALTSAVPGIAPGIWYSLADQRKQLRVAGFGADSAAPIACCSRRFRSKRWSGASSWFATMVQRARCRRSNPTGARVGTGGWPAG